MPSSRALPRLFHLRQAPGSSIRAKYHGGLFGIAEDDFFYGVPLHTLSRAQGNVAQVADGRGAVAYFHVADWTALIADCLEPVGVMVLAYREMHVFVARGLLQDFRRG